MFYALKKCMAIADRFLFRWGMAQLTCACACFKSIQTQNQTCLTIYGHVETYV